MQGCRHGGGRDHLSHAGSSRRLIVVRLPAAHSASTLGTCPSRSPCPAACLPFTAQSERQELCPISHAPSSPLSSAQGASHMVLGTGPARLFLAAVLQALLMDCDGPDFRVYYGAWRGKRRESHELGWGCTGAASGLAFDPGQPAVIEILLIHV